MLKEFISDRCQNYMSEKELDEFKEVTMPKYLNTPTRLDPSMKAVLEKRGHNKIISVDEE